jgi:hypothetical protein
MSPCHCPRGFSSAIRLCSLRLGVGPLVSVGRRAGAHGTNPREGKNGNGNDWWRDAGTAQWHMGLSGQGMYHRVVVDYFKSAAPSYEELLRGAALGSPAREGGAAGDRVLPLLRAGLLALRACPALRDIWQAGPLFPLLVSPNQDVRWTAARLLGTLLGLVSLTQFTVIK